MKSSLAIAGLLIGSMVGFLLRPSVPILGQLPFRTVITRGANLQGLDQLLTGYARTSFNGCVSVPGIILRFPRSKQNPTNRGWTCSSATVRHGQIGKRCATYRY